MKRGAAGTVRLLIGLFVFAFLVGGVVTIVRDIDRAVRRHRPPVAAVAATSSTAPQPAAPSQYRLIVEPATGLEPIYSLISSAKSSLDMTMYELSDRTAEDDLVADAARGVKVRVLLDSAYHGQSVNEAAFSYLGDHGVTVKWAPHDVIFHQKTITVDGETSAIGTGNLTAYYYTSSRDYWVLDANPADVSAIAHTFTADWAGDPVAPGPAGADLIWSPGSSGQLAGLLASARTSVSFESEELSDPAIVSALANDAKRGVTCRVVMEDQRTWAPAFTELTAAGCKVRTYPQTASLYIHAKIALIDAGEPTEELFVGSENGSVASLTYDRELGLVFDGADGGQAISTVTSTFASDFAGGATWK